MAADGMAVRRDGARRTETALHRRGRGARRPRRRCRVRSRGRSRSRRGVAQVAIRREPAPVLVAAIERGRTGSPAARSARGQSPTAMPRPCSRSAACTPPAASSPNADPPDSTIASTVSTVLCGASRSVSRPPGAPPSTLTDATAGRSNTITVTPEPSRRSSALPTAASGRHPSAGSRVVASRSRPREWRSAHRCRSNIRAVHSGKLPRASSSCHSSCKAVPFRLRCDSGSTFSTGRRIWHRNFMNN